MSKFGEFFKNERQSKGISLRQFCKKNHFDASNVSKMERGLINPPGDDILETYAEALGIEIGSSKWQTMRDLAHVARKSIPPEVLTDEAVEQRLPLFFRNARGEKLSEEEMKELFSIIKKS